MISYTWSHDSEHKHHPSSHHPSSQCSLYLGINSTFDRPAIDGNISLFVPKRVTLGNTYHFLDQVQASDAFCDGMLNLQGQDLPISRCGGGGGLATKSCLTLFQLHGLQPTRLLCTRDFPGKNTRVSCHFLLRGIFPTQGSNPRLLHWRQMLYHWATREAPTDVGKSK